MKVSSNTKAWIIVSTVVGVVLILVSLFFYNNFFRQSHAPLIETVPTDAAFVFEINDNEQFVKSSALLMPSLTDLFALDGLAGFESFIERRQNINEEILVSGFVQDGTVVSVFSTRMDEHYFNNLLKSLQIDPRNHIKFEEYAIFSYGTHYKKYMFVFHNGVFSASDNLELLKKTIIQLKYPKGLTNQKSFRQLYKLVEKNEKQNWLLVNPKEYAKYLTALMTEKKRPVFDYLSGLSEWCAYQIRFVDNEILLSGYLFADCPAVKKYRTCQVENDFPLHLIPASANKLVSVGAKDYQKIACFFAENPNLVTKEAADIYRQIAPVHSMFFTLTADTNAYHYYLMKVDASTSSLASLFPENTDVDSLLQNTPDAIFEVESLPFTSMLSYLYKNESFSCFTKINDYFIFADTASTLEYYKYALKNTNYMETSLPYKFASSNTPSDGVFNYLFINHNNAVQAALEEQFAKKSSLNKLSVFSFSHTVPAQKLMGSTVYVKF